MGLMVNRGMENTQVEHARGIRGKRGDVILELPSGKIALPRGFTPQEGEWYDVDVVEDRGRYAIVRLHQHNMGESGICVTCGRTVDYNKLRSFAERWLGNMLHSERIKKIKETKTLILKRFDELISDIDEMINRVDKMAAQHRASVNMCPPGYPTTDGCFSDLCVDKECVQLEATIMYLEQTRNTLSERRWGASRALEYDTLVTVTDFGIERIFVPGI